MKTSTFKQALGIIFGMMLICATPVAAYTETDTEYLEEISPQYVEINTFDVSLSIDAVGTATCNCDINLYHAKGSITVKMELQQKQSSAWKSIKTWYVTDTNPCSAEKTYAVNKGYDYRVYVTATIYDGNGNQIEQGTQYSDIKHY